MYLNNIYLLDIYIYIYALLKHFNLNIIFLPKICVYIYVQRFANLVEATFSQMFLILAGFNMLIMSMTGVTVCQFYSYL